LIAENAARDAKMTFEGMLLSNVALVVDEYGANVVTSIERAKMKQYEALSVISIKMNFNSGGGGDETSEMFFFDNEVFGSDLSIELAVRCILVISGKPVDGVCDISEYWTPPSGSSQSSKMSVQRNVWGPADTEDMEVSPSGIMGFSGSTGLSKVSNSVQRKVLEMGRSELDERLIANLRKIHAERQAQLKEEFEAWKKEKIEASRQRVKDVIASPSETGRAAKKAGRRLPIGVPAAIGKEPTIEVMWMEKIMQSRAKILNFQIGKIIMYVSMETLTTPSVRMRFYSHNTVSSTGRLMLMIDPAIFEGSVDRERLEQLSLFGLLNEPQKKLAIRTRPTWLEELEDLDKAFHGAGLNRLDELNAVQFIHVYGSGYPGCQVIEWATKDAPPSIFDPPGWDFDAVLERILDEMIAEAERSGNLISWPIRTKDGQVELVSAIVDSSGSVFTLENHRPRAAAASNSIKTPQSGP